MLNFMQIRPVGAKLFHADRQAGRQAGMAKLKVAFRNLRLQNNGCLAWKPIYIQYGKTQIFVNVTASVTHTPLGCTGLNKRSVTQSMPVVRTFATPTADDVYCRL
jgi:hypothetical protein